MYYALAGVIAPVFFIGAKNALKSSNKQQRIVGVAGMFLVAFIYILGLAF